MAFDLFRAGTSSDEALSWLATLERELDHRVGKPTGAQGERSTKYLREHSMRRAALEYRYARYLAQLSAMNFGARGIRVREQYQWLPTDS